MNFFKFIDKVATIFDTAAKPTTEFVLKVLGAFGACWGTFSSVDVTRKQIFGYSDNDNLMDNPMYAKTALCISVSAALLSSYVIIREKLSERSKKYSYHHETGSALEEVMVMVPFNQQTSQKIKKVESENSLSLELKTVDENKDKNDSESTIAVLCKKKCN